MTFALGGIGIVLLGLWSAPLTVVTGVRVRSVDESGVVLAGGPWADEALGAGDAAKPPPKGPKWTDARELRVEGKGWSDTERFFDRLPSRARKTVRKAVWGLSRHSAGMCIRFETDATAIRARWTLLSKSLAMTHMPATGVSGLDLYAQDARGQWRWLAIGRPRAQRTEAQLVGGLPPGRRAFMLYLPLYNGVDALEVAVSPGASLRPLPPRKTRPMVFYGTSICQGGCASRPGMVYTAILGRRLDREAVNLGFSGNGTMDAEVAALMAELDPCVYVIDCLPNMNAAAVAQRTEPLVRILRKARPKTPIVLAEDRTYASARFRPSLRARHATSRAALRKAFDRLVASGVAGHHNQPGEPQIGDDGEGTVDGSHPTDLGFVRMADAFEPVLRPLV